MLEKNFSPTMEESIYQYWEKAGYFKPKGIGTAFSIVAPPPNVTGILHMGHALNLTLQDILVRYKRMQGGDVLWVPGTDHAGIATQNVVERHIQKQGTSRFDMGRSAFVDRVWQWKEEYGHRITTQIRKMGASVDWDHERFTMDPGCSAAVVKTFIDLYDKKLIYRGRYLINWCPRCKTALSDVEVEHRDIDGNLWSLKYPFYDDENNGLVVATTRPETMFGDTALAVHPDDTRYQHLIGKKVRIPLTQTLIPIIADTYVDPTFGTGVVKITPAHDFNDFEVGKRHHLDQVMVLNDEAKMIEPAPEQFIGKDRYECRKILLESLKEQGYLIETKPHALSIGECYRCKTVVEPYLSFQWFVDMKTLAQKSIEAVKSGQIQLIPERWEKIYFDWMESIRDWCISRQIWWGHQIPVWYCEAHPDEPIASVTPLTQCPKCGGTALTQDQDVLDTWFSSGLWPFETLGWPEETTDLQRYYPTSVLVTGYDILTFWVSRMITMGLEQTQKIPFSKVFIHGLVRDITGKKMSKSSGNALDPLSLISTYGTDALRFALTSLTTLGGQDIKFSEEKVESSRNFANKIWNAARYILMVVEETGKSIQITNTPKPMTLADQWILSVFFETLIKLNQAYEEFNYSLVAELLWDFIWNQFCDWYIEMSKIEKESSLPTLIFVFTQSLKGLHPVMPFISESIWKHFYHFSNEPESLMLANWPKIESQFIQPEIAAQINKIIPIIREIRNLRKTAEIQPKIVSQIFIQSEKTEIKTAIQKCELYIQKLAKVSEIIFLENGIQKPENALASVVEEVQLFLSLEGIKDNAEEKKRLNEKLIKLQAELARIQSKLANTNFVEKAPKEVVDGIRAQYNKLEEEERLIQAQIAGL